MAFHYRYEDAERAARRHAGKTGRTYGVYDVAGLFPMPVDGALTPAFYEEVRAAVDDAVGDADERIISEVRPADLDVMLAACRTDLDRVAGLVAVLS
jgi:hypothetical protein